MGHVRAFFHIWGNYSDRLQRLPAPAVPAPPSSAGTLLAISNRELEPARRSGDGNCNDQRKRYPGPGCRDAPAGMGSHGGCQRRRCHGQGRRGHPHRLRRFLPRQASAACCSAKRRKKPRRTRRASPASTTGLSWNPGSRPTNCADRRRAVRRQGRPADVPAVEYSSHSWHSPALFAAKVCSMITPLKRFLCPAEFSGHRTGCLVLAVHPEQSEAPLAARP